MATAKNDQTSGTPSVPRAWLIPLYVLALAIGLVPYSLLIQSWLFLLVTTGLIAVMAVFAMRANTHYVGRSPAPIEIVLGLLGSSVAGMVCGLFGFATIFLVSGVISGSAWLIGWEVSDVAERWVTYVSMGVVGFFAVAISGNDARSLIKKLYPSFPDQRSSYFALASQSKHLWLLLVGVLIGVLAMWLISPLPHFFSGLFPWLDSLSYSRTALLFVSLYWVIIGQNLWEVKDPDLPRVSDAASVAKIKILLEAAGYQVLTYPQTGDKEADPLIALLDFVAIRPDRALAGFVKGNTDPGFLRHELASLQPAVWALEDQLSKRRKIDLEPVLVVIGAASNAKEDSEALESVAKMGVCIIRTPPEAELNKIIADKDDERRTSKAKELFDAPASNPMVTSALAAASQGS